MILVRILVAKRQAHRVHGTQRNEIDVESTREMETEKQHWYVCCVYIEPLSVSVRVYVIVIGSCTTLRSTVRPVVGNTSIGESYVLGAAYS